MPMRNDAGSGFNDIDRVADSAVLSNSLILLGSRPCRLRRAQARERRAALSIEPPRPAHGAGLVSRGVRESAHDLPSYLADERRSEATVSRAIEGG